MFVPSLDPDLLQAFVAVADHLSFTQAAASLNRTQSAVSQQVKRLEQRLDVELFVRTRISVRITPSGERLLGYARRMLALNAEAVETLGRRRVVAHVRLGVMEDYGSVLMPPLLARFTARHPDVGVTMETGLTSSLLKRIGESFDLVIAMHPEGAGDGELLRKEQPLWATSPRHRVETREPLPMALYPEGCLFRKWAMDALDRAGRPWSLAFASQSLRAVEAVVHEGLAVTVVKSGTFPPSLRPLTASDGFPALPVADIRLHRAPSSHRAAAALSAYLIEDFETVPALAESGCAAGRLTDAQSSALSPQSPA